MTTEQQVAILSRITTRDEAGQHFTTNYSDRDLIELESAGLIAIRRPKHEATGIDYSSEHWSIEVTEAGQDLVDANREYHAV